MAIKKVYELSVDLKKTTTRVNVPVLVQGDSAEFRIRLLDNGAELSTGELTGITAVRMQSGYDAQTVIRTVGTLQGSVAVFHLQKGELFRSGTVQAMVQLEDSADRISTLRFQYQVIPDLAGNYIPGEQDITVFQRYMNDAQVKIDEINAAAEVMAATDVAQLTVKLAETDDKLNVDGWELNSKGREKKGITVFVSDDGRIEEYTIMKSIFEAEGVPFNLAIVSDWVGRTDFLNQTQLLELQNELAWEILSHSKTHPTSSAPKMIPDMSDAEAEYEFSQSKKELIAMGLKVESYAHVAGAFGKRERMMTKKYYRAARSSAYGHDGLNLLPLESHELKTIVIDASENVLKNNLDTYTRSEAIQRTFDYAKRHIDEAKRDNALLIITTHSRWFRDQLDLQHLFRDIIRYANQHTEVTTLSKALNKVGNLVEVGDYSKMGIKAPGTSHFVVGANGLISGSASISEHNEFLLSTHIRKFPIGITYTTISSANATNAPTGEAGTLITHYLNDTSTGYNFQEYHVFRSRRSYKRSLNNDRSWGAWEPTDEVTVDRTTIYNPSTPFSVIPSGLTYSYVNHIVAGTSDAPEQGAGLLVTYKFNGLEYQEYRLLPDSVLRNIYVRNVSNGVFGSWRLFTPGMILPESNTLSPASLLSDFSFGVTYSAVSSALASTTSPPEEAPGLLITHRVSNSVGMNYQEYHIFNSPKVYKRTTNSLTSWGTWTKISAV